MINNNQPHRIYPPSVPTVSSHLQKKYNLPAVLYVFFFFFCQLSNDFFVFLFQIRAANLSGDCAFQNEAARFNFGLEKHHQVIA